MDLIRNSPAFRNLDETSLAEIGKLCTPRLFAPGETVFRQGEPGHTLVGLVSGKIRISVASQSGQELNLNLIEPGEFVGEIAFIDGGLRTATGVAITASNCITIRRKPFFALMDRRPQISRHLLSMLCDRVRWTSQLVADSAFLSVPDRMTSRLLDIAQADESGVMEVTDVRLPQQELADYLGVSRQVVNGYLRSWQQQGKVRLSRGRIALLPGFGAERLR
jgi:CRP-like cAMP-binding protein